MKYDIFISYRRQGGAQYARILQLMLIQRGYRVFLDYDELTDGVFSEKIKKAIHEAPVFMIVLSNGALDRCVNVGDWVRKEISLAVELKKHIIPVNPDNGYSGVPKEMPDDLMDAINLNQHSEINFGQLLGATIDLMIMNRLVPTLGNRVPIRGNAEDHMSVQRAMHTQKTRSRFIKRLEIFCTLVVILGVGLWFWDCQKEKELKEDELTARNEMRMELHEKHKIFMLQLNSDLTIEQMATIDTMLMNMSPVIPDSIWMGQFEFTIGEWYGIMGKPYEESMKNMPITNISFAEIYKFLLDLGNMTNINVELPSAEVWEYTAHGGEYNETTLYVGNDDVDKVAWYKENSGGTAHPSDGQQGKEPNMLDIYDMSGNVSEMCNTYYKNGLYTVCGGNYDSAAEDVTAASRKGFAADAKDEHVGFRIIIRKP